MSEEWIVRDDHQLNAFVNHVIQQHKAGKVMAYKWRDADLRTVRQNNAMWLWLGQLSDELNAAGFDMKKTLKEHVPIPWNKELAKEFLWNPIQKAVTKKPSSTRLTRKEVNEVQETLARYLAETKGIAVPFPAYDPNTDNDLSEL